MLMSTFLLKEVKEKVKFLSRLATAPSTTFQIKVNLVAVLALSLVLEMFKFEYEKEF